MGWAILVGGMGEGALDAMIPPFAVMQCGIGVLCEVHAGIAGCRGAGLLCVWEGFIPSSLDDCRFFSFRIFLIGRSLSVCEKERKHAEKEMQMQGTHVIGRGHVAYGRKNIMMIIINLIITVGKSWDFFFFFFFLKKILHLTTMIARGIAYIERDMKSTCFFTGAGRVFRSLYTPLSKLFFL